MLVDIVSDLHLDIWGINPNQFSDYLVQSKGADTLIIAGDSYNGRGKEKFLLSALSRYYKTIITVDGNHELYGEESLEEKGNYTFLLHDNGNHTTVAVTPYWTDFGGMDPSVVDNCSKNISDFKLSEYATPVAYDTLNSLAKEFLIRSKADVWVTHWSPFVQSIHPKHAGSPLNPYFANDHEQWFNDYVNHKPKLVIHGHTHSKLDYMMGGTRVVCNPLGYPGENFTQVNIGNYQPLTINLETMETHREYNF